MDGLGTGSTLGAQGFRNWWRRTAFCREAERIKKGEDRPLVSHLCLARTTHLPSSPSRRDKLRSTSEWKERFQSIGFAFGMAGNNIDIESAAP
jgi:hypothetical protein